MTHFHRRGFTIMELLIASTLAAILMVGILFATTQQAKQVQRLQTQTSPLHFDTVIQMLRSDLMLATACKVTEDQIQLQGYMQLNSKTQSQTQKPAHVIYRLVAIGNDHWLIRHQRDPSSLTLQDSSANLLCKGITSMQLLASELPESFDDEPIEISPTNEQLPTQEQIPTEITDNWGSLPTTVQWIITLANDSQDATIDDWDQEQKTKTFTMVLR
ncbi:MAG TPA: hypothetical protein DER01_08640 [Phycisphaerales bacterium]|nr:hypothetical protein [Phycisphaerales bacterium]|tara:strand:+ start:1680 stop:2327 length:648 start_codon:yes stop_codon:yes gene_type:complete